MCFSIVSYASMWFKMKLRVIQNQGFYHKSLKIVIGAI
jgi:hypothetical protein